MKRLDESFAEQNVLRHRSLKACFELFIQLFSFNHSHLNLNCDRRAITFPSLPWPASLETAVYTRVTVSTLAHRAPVSSYHTPL